MQVSLYLSPHFDLEKREREEKDAMRMRMIQQWRPFERAKAELMSTLGWFKCKENEARADAILDVDAC